MTRRRPKGEPTLFDVHDTGDPERCRPLTATEAAPAPELEAQRFDGSTIGEHENDEERLGRLLSRVLHFMSDNEWHTLAEIKVACGGTEASCSARLRDLRKQRFGEHVIDRQAVPCEPGLFRYRLVAPPRKRH